MLSSVAITIKWQCLVGFYYPEVSVRCESSDSGDGSHTFAGKESVIILNLNEDLRQRPSR